MKTDIKINKFKTIIKTICMLSVGVASFLWGLHYTIAQSDGYISMLTGGLLSLSASLILMGFMHKPKEHGGGILAGMGFFAAIGSGIVYFGSSIFYMMG